jgi:2-dehydropantoate 2-reductase
MQIVVLGAGAIGSLYGAKLAAGNDVTLVGRAEHVNAIEEEGLRVEGLETKTVFVPAATRVTKLQPNALILLTTKVQDTASALQPLVSLIGKDTTIVTLQNGLNSDGIVRAIVAERAAVLRGITQFGAIYERPGTIRYMAKGHTLLENHERSVDIAAILNAAGLDCHISADITMEVWRKLVFNCVVNPVTAIVGCEVGGIVDPRLDPLKRLIIEECVAVARAEGIALEVDFLREINATYAGSHNIVSMRQDLLRGRTTEIDYLNGAIVTLGATHGLECAVNRGLTSIIKGLEAASRKDRSANLLVNPMSHRSSSEAPR